MRINKKLPHVERAAVSLNTKTRAGNYSGFVGHGLV